MDFEAFLKLAKMYSALGWSVQEQLEQIMDGEPLDDLNPNAMKMILDLVKAFERHDGCADEDSFNVRYAIEEHLGEQ